MKKVILVILIFALLALVYLYIEKKQTPVIEPPAPLIEEETEITPPAQEIEKGKDKG